MIFERLMKIAETVLEESDLSNATSESTLEELGVNSISMLMLMVGIEDEFAIRFPAERVGELKTIGDVGSVSEGCRHV